jgi:dTDP-glucose 4,6-dehydratase
MIEGIKRLLFSDYTKPVNLGNPHEMSIIELAKKIVELTGSRSKIEYRPLPKDDPKVRRPDITLAKKVLKWEPKVSFEEGIRETIHYFRQKMGRDE